MPTASDEKPTLAADSLVTVVASETATMQDDGGVTNTTLEISDATKRQSGKAMNRLNRLRSAGKSKVQEMTEIGNDKR